MNLKYKYFHTTIDLSDVESEQQKKFEDLEEKIDDFQVNNPIRVISYLQSESLDKDKCHITATLEYDTTDDRQQAEYLN